jgi:glycosyltransferase involved in cell wall biosynthesis
VRILHLKAGIDITGGGPSYSTVNLCRALAMQGAHVELFSLGPHGDVPAGTGDGFTVRYFRGSFPSCLYYSRDLIRAVREKGRDFDVFDIHGIWNLISMRAARAAQQLGLPYVITPRGMLSAWQRDFHKPHKEAFFRLYVQRAVQGASLVRFLTSQEAIGSLRHVSVTRYVVVPNGIWPQQFEGLESGAFRQRFGLRSSPYVVFLGRLHPIKRLDLQCAAFKLLAPRFKELHWVFVGPDDGVLPELKKTTKELGLADRVRFTGLLAGRERLSALAGAAVYCHTSDHEGHSVAITEALACGKPCVVTNGCHFDEIQNAFGGYVVAAEPDAIARAIAKLLENRALAAEMGKNAKLLAESRYSWKSTAQKMLSAYYSILCKTGVSHEE